METLKRKTQYACPVCGRSYRFYDDARKCQLDHPVERQVSIACPKCGTWFNAWRCGGEAGAVAMINAHIARNCGIIEGGPLCKGKL